MIALCYPYYLILMLNIGPNSYIHAQTHVHVGILSWPHQYTMVTVLLNQQIILQVSNMHE